MIKILSLLLIGLLTVSTARADNGVEVELEIFQKDSNQNDVLLFSDTVDFVENLVTTGFLVNFSLDLEFTRIDTGSVSFTVHIVTVRPNVNNYSKLFKVQYGLPAKIEPIESKNGSVYSFVITPLKQKEIDRSYCSYDHREQGLFRITPSANMNFYHIKGSFGEYNWQLAKGVLEENYEQLLKLFKFNLPGKYNIYLSPCAVNSIIWDKRFGVSVDPTKSTGYTIFNGRYSTFDPFVSAHAAILRNFGYAPPFLSEGMANFLSFAVFDMKDIITEKKNIPLRELLNTYNYFNADPTIADRTSASFVRFLIRQNNYDQLMKVYEMSDDLNLAGKIEEVYGKSIEEIETEWITYVDTLTFLKPRLVKYVELSEAMFKYPQMAKYSKKLVELADTEGDSLMSLSMLRTAYFNMGDYYNAIQTQEQLLKMENNSRSWMSFGINNMMNGFYDEALSNLLTAKSLDTLNSLIQFNLGLCYENIGDNEEAAKYYNLLIASEAPQGAMGESRVMLGRLLLNSKNEKDKARAITLFSEAEGILSKMISSQSPTPVFLAWLGMAYLGQGDTDNAYNYLSTALMLETRPFYLGLINLELGKVVDLLNDHATAKEYYSQVIASPSAAYHQAEAKKLIDNPYKQ